MKAQDFSFEISIVFDNKCAKIGYLTGFGFSALIFNNYTQQYLLFDVGQNGDILIHNINKLNICLSEINKAIISHNHFDHTGGLSELLRKNSEIEIFVPRDVEEIFRRTFPQSTISAISESIEIEKNIFSSGQLGNDIKEQALFLMTKQKKILIIVGCTHPGLENFILKAREKAEIEAIIGGFHGFKKYSFLENINLIGACHCTRNINDIKRRFPDQFKEVCVGDSIIF